MPDEQLPRYVTAGEAAQILHVTAKTVARWANEGRLPFLRTLGGHHRYPEDELRAIADANTITAEHPIQ